MSTKPQGRSWVQQAADKTYDPANDILKWDSKIKFHDFAKEPNITGRFIGPLFTLARHWVPILGKFKNGGMPQVFPTWCPRCNPSTGKLDAALACPLHEDFNQNATLYFVSDMIIRAHQDDLRKNPVVPVLLPVRDTKVFLDKMVAKLKGDLADPVKGMDVDIEFNPDAKNKDPKWIVTPGSRTQLSDEEQAYVLTDFSTILPNYADEAVNSLHARTLKENLVRLKYYVMEQENGKGWAKYKADPNGRPYINFPELEHIASNKNREGQIAFEALEAGSGGSSSATTVAVDVMPRPAQATVKASGVKVAPRALQPLAADPTEGEQLQDDDIPFDQGSGKLNKQPIPPVNESVVVVQKVKEVAVAKALQQVNEGSFQPTEDAVEDEMDSAPEIYSGPASSTKWTMEHKIKWNQETKLPTCYEQCNSTKKKCTTCPVKVKCLATQSAEGF